MVAAGFSLRLHRRDARVTGLIEVYPPIRYHFNHCSGEEGAGNGINPVEDDAGASIPFTSKAWLRLTP